MGRYFDELKRAMSFLGDKPDTVFLGQSCCFEGTAMFRTLSDVPMSKRIEFPVIEETQMGVTNGLALAGHVPISLFPRWNFLLLATNQIVNHLDVIPIISDYRPKAIIRTSIGSERPFDPQAQHKGDYTEAFKLMCKSIDVIKLEEPEDIFPAYKLAYERTDGRSTLLIEYGDFLNEK